MGGKKPLKNRSKTIKLSLLTKQGKITCFFMILSVLVHVCKNPLFLQKYLNTFFEVYLRQNCRRHLFPNPEKNRIRIRTSNNNLDQI